MAITGCYTLFHQPENTKPKEMGKPEYIKKIYEQKGFWISLALDLMFTSAMIFGILGLTGTLPIPFAASITLIVWGALTPLVIAALAVLSVVSVIYFIINAIFDTRNWTGENQN
jgi:hypothetical protein